MKLIQGRAEDHLHLIAPDLIVTDAPKSMMVWLTEYAEKHDCVVINVYARRWIDGAHGVKDWTPYYALMRSLPSACLTVCDPFMGTGAVGVAAVLSGYGFVGIEANRERFETAKETLDALQDPAAAEARAGLCLDQRQADPL